MRRALLAALALVVAASGRGYADVDRFDRSAESGRKWAQNLAVGTKKFRYRAFGERINLLYLSRSDRGMSLCRCAAVG
jgi:hypothetical protein